MWRLDLKCAVFNCLSLSILVQYDGITNYSYTLFMAIRQLLKILII